MDGGGVVIFVPPSSKLLKGSGDDEWLIINRQSPRTHHTAVDRQQRRSTPISIVPQSFLFSFHTDSNYKQKQQH
jgi:hypothetical protein